MTTSETGKNVSEPLVDRCVALLLDDHARQGGYLNVDDISRVLSRRKLTPEHCSAVWQRLTDAGVQISEPPDEPLPAAPRLNNVTAEGPRHARSPDANLGCRTCISTTQIA